MRPLPWQRFAALGALALAGCAGAADGFGTGALLSLDYFGDTDVVGFHYEVSNTSCAGEPIVPNSWAFNVNLLDNVFPGMVTHVETVLDPDSRHLGADLFVSLEPGCYVVTATPASAVDVTDAAAWTPSADCSSTTSDPIEVVDGATTEAPVLVSQCVGDPIGALDQTVVLNHPPVITIAIDEKYNYECETVEACVTAYDPDDDPLEILFEKTAGPAQFSLDQGTAEVVGFEDGHRVWQQCAQIATRWTASYDYTVTVWDLGPQGRFEDVVGQDSRDEMTFPVHTNWVEEPLCFDASGTLVFAPDVDIDRAPGCSYTDAETYYCSGNYAVDPAIVAFLCDGTTLIEEALYPNCDGSTPPPPPEEIPCDGIDNDNDGDIDEGSEYGDEYTWVKPANQNQNANGGTTTALALTYNDLDDTLAIGGSITSPSNRTTNFFEFAVNNGPNPNGEGELAMFYVDFSTGTLIVTAYAYNASSVYTSHADGSPASGVQPADPIVSSLLDPTFIVAEAYELTGGVLTFDIVLDVSSVNSHTPTYWNPGGWLGAQFNDLFGIWYHPATDVSTAYNGGYVDSFSRGPFGWIDNSNRPTTSVPVCR
jgi:hypothetical protein